MSAKSIAAVKEMLPSVFDDFFRPWNEWFDGKGVLHRAMTVPAVNITDEKDHYAVTLAAPGMSREDFSVDVDGSLLSVSAERQEEKEEKEKKFTRKEYNYASFSRSFTLPEEVIREKIEARYSDGILTINLPKKQQSDSGTSTRVRVQ